MDLPTRNKLRFFWVDVKSCRSFELNIVVLKCDVTGFLFSLVEQIEDGLGWAGAEKSLSLVSFVFPKFEISKSSSTGYLPHPLLDYWNTST
jgi:hypothetical protein